MNGVRLLLVDDDKGMGEQLHGTLEQLGFGVTRAIGGRDALDRLAAGEFDVVAFDQTEAGLDGLEALAQIQRMPAKPPVVFVADSSDCRVATAALKAGAANYVSRDLQREFIPTLIAAINDVLAMKRRFGANEACESGVRAARDRFAALAVERAVMLREVNHRVGNSLQLVTALLSLQASAIDNPETKTALSEAMARVMAVAQLHKSLFTAEDQRRLSLDRYLGALLEDLAMPVARQRAKLTLSTEPVTIEPDRALAVGLIVTELVADALRHAPANSSAAIRIALRRENGHAALTVEDDRPAAAGPGELSNTILQAMAAKLDAGFSAEDLDPGRRVTMTFKPDLA